MFDEVAKRKFLKEAILLTKECLNDLKITK